MTTDLKECPYCGESIRIVAIRCKHCHADLSAPFPEIRIATNPANNAIVNTDKQLQVTAVSTLAPSEVADLIMSLVGRSLVTFDEASGRYRLLETIRQYTMDLLMEAGELEKWQDSHLTHFMNVAEQAETQLTRAEQQEWLDKLEAEHDNLRGATSWAIEHHDQHVNGLRLGGAIRRFWFMRGYIREGFDRLSALLAVGPGSDTLAYSKALQGAGLLASEQGDYKSARLFCAESVSVLRSIGDTVRLPAVLITLAHVTADQGDCAAARAHSEESVVISRMTGDRWATASALNQLGWLAGQSGDYPSARTQCMESLQIVRELGDEWAVAHVLYNLGQLACDQADYLMAQTHHAEALTICVRLDDKRGIALSLEGFACALTGLGNWDKAVRLWAVASRLRKELSFPLPAQEQTRYMLHLSNARMSAGSNEVFDRIWQLGETIAIDEAIGIALDG